MRVMKIPLTIWITYFKESCYSIIHHLSLSIQKEPIIIDTFFLSVLDIGSTLLYTLGMKS